MGKLGGLPIFHDTMDEYMKSLNDKQFANVFRAAMKYAEAFDNGEECNAPEFDSAEEKTAYEKMIEDIHYYAECDEEDKPF